MSNVNTNTRILIKETTTNYKQNKSTNTISKNW